MKAQAIILPNHFCVTVYSLESIGFEGSYFESVVEDALDMCEEHAPDDIRAILQGHNLVAELIDPDLASRPSRAFISHVDGSPDSEEVVVTLYPQTILETQLTPGERFVDGPLLEVIRSDEYAYNALRRWLNRIGIFDSKLLLTVTNTNDEEPDNLPMEPFRSDNYNDATTSKGSWRRSTEMISGLENFTVQSLS